MFLLQYFEYRLFSYYYDEEKHKFFPKSFNLNELTNNKIHQIFGQGINTEESYEERKVFFGIYKSLIYQNQQFSYFLGENSTEIPEKSIFYLLFEEVFSSFFVFQVKKSYINLNKFLCFLRFLVV